MSPFILVIFGLLLAAFWRQAVAMAIVVITIVFVVGCVDVAHMVQSGAVR